MVVVKFDTTKELIPHREYTKYLGINKLDSDELEFIIGIINLVTSDNDNIPIASPENIHMFTVEQTLQYLHKAINDKLMVNALEHKLVDIVSKLERLK